VKTKLLPAVGEEPVMLHGADYNPDQWLAYPEVLEEDIRLMKLARCNVMSVGIFSWAALWKGRRRWRCTKATSTPAARRSP